MANERVLLYGVPLVADRLINFGKVDRALSRELFIRHALVYGEWSSRQKFFTRNRELLDEAAALEHRARRRDIVVDEHTLFDFYDARVGADVVSGAHFDTWWKSERQKNPELLTFDLDMLTHDAAEAVGEHEYPSTWQGSREGLTFPISYHFEPGAEDDGLTIDVPVATLNQVADDDFSWNVPGLREELVTSLIRSLPKNLRVALVPAPDRAREFLRTVPPGEEPLLDALERWCRATTGVHVPRDSWDWSRVAEHLRPTYRVVDDAGTVQARGKDLEALKAPLQPQFAEAMAEVAGDSGLARSGETTWAFGTLEATITQRRAGHEVTAHPALDDEGDTVGLAVHGSAEEAAARHRLGVRRLLEIALPDTTASLVADLTNAEKLGLAGSPYPSVAELLADCRTAVLADVVDARPPVRDEATFDALVVVATRDHDAAVRATMRDVIDVLAAWRSTDKALGGRVDMMQLPALTDMQAQLARLVDRGFIGRAGASRLRRYPIYLRALELRRDRLDEGGGAVHRDRLLHDQVVALQDAYLHRIEALPAGRPPEESLRRVRWMLEEYRVSLWAQQLGTDGPVSDQRIRKALA